MAVRWWEPWPPAERTCSTPSPSRSATHPDEVDLAVGPPRGTARRRPPAPRDACSVGVPGHPAQGRAGEQLEAHHRRHRVAGQPEHRACRPTSPKANGLAGRMAICIQRMSPMRSSTTFTRSMSPIDTPPLVSTASQVAAPSLDRRGDGGLVVADQPEVDGLPALLRDQGEERGPVGVADLARRRAAARPRRARRRWTARRRAAAGAPAPRRRRCRPARRGGRRRSPRRARTRRRRRAGRRRPPARPRPPAPPPRWPPARRRRAAACARPSRRRRRRRGSARR